MSALRVLAIDDVASRAGALRAALSDSGVRVSLADSLPAALEIADRDRPDLVLVPRQLRRLSLKAWVSAFAARGIPVVLITEDVSWNELIRSLRSGASGILAPPAGSDWVPRLEEILAAHRASAKDESQEPGTGQAKHFLRVMEQTACTGSFVVTSSRMLEGRSTFRNGALQSSEYGPLNGLSALQEMLTLEGGVWTYDDRPPPAPRTASSTEAPSSAAGTRVLIVDDAPELRKLYSLRLKRSGFDVETAEDGQEGLELLEQRPYDAVIADLNMPRLDGWGLLRRMQDDARLKELPVIFLSAHDDYRETLKAARAGASDYLSKTGKADHVIERLGSLVLPRRRVRALLDASTEPFTVPLPAVGTFWLLETLASISGTFAVESRDQWGHHRVVVSEGTLTECHAAVAERQTNGPTALAGFLLARPREATVTRLSGLDSPTHAPSMKEALAHAREALRRLDTRVEHEKLRHNAQFQIDTALYALYREIGSHEMLAFARAVCEERTPVPELSMSLGMTPESVERGLRELLRRRVISFPEDETAA